jgi:alkanesulfonate monooxygenase SsuD/methylene tetrahydromethanopterin reductase-like flavin-dependent oxidoreductase (luciferase family)
LDTVALAAAAGATKTIGLFTNVLLAPVWPPVLFAKEAAGIDAVSGGRLTLGLGVGGRPDDFVVDGFGLAGRGRRFEEDLAVYRDVWQGELIGGGPNPAVTPGARQIPLIIGGGAPASFDRMARWGQGYVTPAAPPPAVAPAFEAARAAWAQAGREGSPYLVAVAYFAVGDIQQGRANVWDYCTVHGEEIARMMADGVAGGQGPIKDRVAAYADLGVDELIFTPSVGDIDEISRLADTVL